MIEVIQLWGPIIFSGLSLIVSVISLVKAAKAQSLQNKVNSLELKLKQYEFDKISKEQEAAKLACVEARVIKFGRNKYRLKLWNSGESNAYDVNIVVENRKEFITVDKDILPFEVLQPNKSIEIPVITGFGAAKFKITTNWKNADGEFKMNEQYVSL